MWIPHPAHIAHRLTKLPQPRTPATRSTSLPRPKPAVFPPNTPWRGAHLALPGSFPRRAGGCGRGAGPLLAAERRAQGQAAELLQVEEEQELQRVHRELRGRHNDTAASGGA